MNKAYEIFDSKIASNNLYNSNAILTSSIDKNNIQNNNSLKTLNYNKHYNSNDFDNLLNINNKILDDEISNLSI